MAETLAETRVMGAGYRRGGLQPVDALELLAGRRVWLGSRIAHGHVRSRELAKDELGHKGNTTRFYNLHRRRSRRDYRKIVTSIVAAPMARTTSIASA